ncbi:MAG: hypothetical protein IT383_25170 [Deltaproteobacteria bacterium]|nr:hypothetical protein [Deltaproteobacteria bacterium]
MRGALCVALATALDDRNGATQENGMRALVLLPSALALCTCLDDPRPRLVDCQALADEQPQCMDDEAMAACTDANDACAEEGVVAVGESCPLSFSCSAG